MTKPHVQAAEAQHLLYFLPLPHGQGSLRPIFLLVMAAGVDCLLGAGGLTLLVALGWDTLVCEFKSSTPPLKSECDTSD